MLWPLVVSALGEAETNDPWSLLAGQPSLVGESQAYERPCLKTKAVSTRGVTAMFVLWPYQLAHTCMLYHKAGPKMVVLLAVSYVAAWPTPGKIIGRVNRNLNLVSLGNLIMWVCLSGNPLIPFLTPNGHLPRAKCIYLP